MFNRKRTNKTKNKLLTELTAVTTIEKIFSEPKRFAVQESIRQFLLMDSELYSKVALPIYQSLADYCQLLPDSVGNCYTGSAGLIDRALFRTESALRLFNHYCLIENHAASHEQTLWQYALFSAALLQGIGKLQLDYTVHTFDESGDFLEIWNPILSPLVNQAKYYKYSFNQQALDYPYSSLNTLLAYHLMPIEGFKWIASHDKILMTWLAFLSNDSETSDTLGAILGRADLIASRELLFMIKEQLNNDQSIYKRGTFIDGPAQPALSGVEQKIGLNFLAWLHHQLSDGQYVVNQDDLVITSDGMVLKKELFQAFVKNNPHIRSWQAAQQGLMSLGLHQIIAGGKAMSRFELAKYQQKDSALVLTHYGIVLPDKLTLFNKSTNQNLTVKAVELSSKARMNQLASINAKGEWIKPVTASEHPSHNKIFRNDHG